MKVKLRTINTTSFIASLNNTKKQVRDAATSSVMETGNVVLDLANKRVPIVSGALRSSGNVTEEALGGSRPRAVISYGNSTLNPDGTPTSEYAIERHELYNSKKPEAHKWLEFTLLTEEETILNDLAARIKSKLN